MHVQMKSQTKYHLEFERQLDHQIDLLESSGRAEAPVRGIRVGEKTWEITDIQTGETIEVIPVENRKIVFVLDGDHVITDDFHVFSLAEKKNVQELNEMAVFFRREKVYPAYFASLPIFERPAYTYNQKAYYVFDTSRVVERLIAFFPFKETIEVWKWDSKTLPLGARGERTKRLTKEYRHTFEFSFDNLIPLPYPAQVLGPHEIGVQFTRSFVI